MFDVMKQLSLNSFCSIMYHAARETDTEEEFKKKLEKEVTEEWLQHVNTTARLYGGQPLSFVGKQRKKRRKSKKYHIKRAVKKYGIPKKLEIL